MGPVPQLIPGHGMNPSQRPVTPPPSLERTSTSSKLPTLPPYLLHGVDDGIGGAAYKPTRVGEAVTDSGPFEVELTEVPLIDERICHRRVYEQL